MIKKKIIETLITLYLEVNQQINELGENIVREHSRGLITRRDMLIRFIEEYAQLNIKGMAYANVKDIVEYLKDDKKPKGKH